MGERRRDRVSDRDDRSTRRLHNFPFGNLSLSGDGVLGDACHTRHTPACKLPGTQSGDNSEFKRIDLDRAMYHRNLTGRLS